MRTNFEQVKIQDFRDEARVFPPFNQVVDVLNAAGPVDFLQLFIHFGS